MNIKKILYIIFGVYKLWTGRSGRSATGSSDVSVFDFCRFLFCEKF